jgi:hypothetical protein
MDGSGVVVAVEAIAALVRLPFSTFFCTLSSTCVGFFRFIWSLSLLDFLLVSRSIVHVYRIDG